MAELVSDDVHVPADVDDPPPPAKLNDPTALQTYITSLASLLGLKDWAIILDPIHACSPNDDAAIYTVSGRKIARLRVSDRWDDMRPERQRRSIIHELIHCHFSHANAVVDQAESHMTARVFALWRDSWLLADEYGTDGISTAIAPVLPLP